MLASADCVDVHQVLVYSEYRYLRFARYHFADLSRVHSDYGWMDYQIDDGGVPGMTYRTDDGKVHAWLYVFIEGYASYHKGSEAMQDDKRIDYERISEDLFIR